MDLCPTIVAMTKKEAKTKKWFLFAISKAFLEQNQLYSGSKSKYHPEAGSS